MGAAPVLPGQASPSACLTDGVMHESCYSHVVEPVAHGRARSARVCPRVSRSPGICAAHHGTPHAWLVHPVFKAKGLNDGTAVCTKAHSTITAPLPPSHKHSLPQRSVCDVTRSIQEAGSWWGGGVGGVLLLEEEVRGGVLWH